MKREERFTVCCKSADYGADDYFGKVCLPVLLQIKLAGR